MLFRGNIVTTNSIKNVGSKSPFLTCTHIAEGHTKAVLSVDATDDRIFTGSKGECVLDMWFR